MSLVLKPCPFCGAHATLTENPAHKHGALAGFMPDHTGSWAVECHACSSGQIRDTRDQAIAAWNTRAPDATADRRVADMREAAAREAAGICRAFAVIVRDEVGPSGDEPEHDAAMSCANLIETRMLGRALPDAPEPQGWRDIATAPKDGTSLLLLVDWEPLWFVGYWGENVDELASEVTWRVKWDGADIEGGYDAPTHWQPLLAAPIRKRRTERL